MLMCFYAGVSKGDFASKSHIVLNLMVINMRGKSDKGKLKQTDCVVEYLGVIKGFGRSLLCDQIRKFHGKMQH